MLSGQPVVQVLPQMSSPQKRCMAVLMIFCRSVWYYLSAYPSRIYVYWLRRSKRNMQFAMQTWWTSIWLSLSSSSNTLLPIWAGCSIAYLDVVSKCPWRETSMYHSQDIYVKSIFVFRLICSRPTSISFLMSYIRYFSCATNISLWT